MTAGVSYLYGYLVVDCTGSGISLENTQEMLVSVAGGNSYQESMSYTITDDLKEVQTDGSLYLRLPVWMYGLKQDTVYTFTVNGYVKYSTATSAYRTIGSTSEATHTYSNTLVYSLSNLTGRPVHDSDPTGEKYDSSLAVGIQLRGTGTSTSNVDAKEDGKIPIEVLSARAVEVTFSELDETGKVLYSQPVVVDLYEKNNMYDTATGEMNSSYGNYVWVNEKGPLVSGYENESGEYTYVLTSADFPDIKNYERVSVEVTKVYDYTYNMGNGFASLQQSNLDGYANEINAISDALPISVARSEPSLMETQCVNATPIVNASGRSTQSEIRIGDDYVLGATDSALDADTKMGYRVQVSEQYPVKTVEEVTYYFFTYDDWVSFTDCQNSVSNADGGNALRNQYKDIVDAARQNDSYWRAKVHQFTIPIATSEWTSTSIPFVDVIYVEQQSDKVDKDTAEYNPASKGYVYYSSKLERGQTWMFSFTTMDTYRMDYTEDEAGKADYLYPYDNPLYNTGNSNVYRSAPQQMDRQAPKVKMTMDYTDADTDAVSEEPVWSIWIYDPDQALGTHKVEITNAEHGTRVNTFVNWKSAVNSTAPDWSDFIVIGSVGTTEAVTAGMTGGTSGNSTNRPTVDWVNAGGKPVTLKAAELEEIFSVEQDSDPFAKGINDGINCVDGITWHGTFRMGNPVSSNGNVIELLKDQWKYYIFLARNLNDSEYPVTKAEYHENLGISGKYALGNPSLYFMAAAEGMYDHVITPEELARVLKIQPQVTTNKLLLSVSKTTNSVEDTKLLEEVNRHLVGLQVSVYQAKTADEKEDYNQYELLKTEMISYSSSSGASSFSVDLTALDEYKSDYGAAVTVEAVYDTGLSGTVLSKLNEQAGIIYGTDLYESQTDLSYGVRAQNSDNWYTGLQGGIFSGRNAAAGNSIWKISGTDDGTARTYRMKEQEMKLDAALAVDQGYTSDGYTSDMVKGAFAGLRHEKTGTSLVYNALAQSSASFLDGDPTVSEVIKATTDVITLGGKQIPVGGAAVFLMPKAVPAVTESTSINNYANKSEVSFWLSTSTYRLMKEDNGTRTFLPYVFVELYEDTQASGSASKVKVTVDGNTLYETEQTYRISNAGNLIGKNFSKTINTTWGGSHTYKPQSYYNTMWGKAGGSYGADSVLNTLAAVDADREIISTKQDTGNQYKFTLSNLIPGKIATGSTGTNYSFRLYVLPTVYEGTAVDYSRITTEQDLQKYKRYLVDGSNSTDKTITKRYYTSSLNMENWFRIQTNNYCTFSTALTASYKAASYTSKYLSRSYALTNQTNAEVYMQYRLTDAEGNVLLDNDDIMSAMSNVEKPVTDKKYTYYDTDGTKKERHIYSFTTTGEINVLNYLGDLLKPKEKYQLWAMVCYMDPTLVNLSDNYMKLGYESANVLNNAPTTWNGEDVAGKLADSAAGIDFDDQVYTTSSAYSNDTTGGYRSIATFTMPEDASPTILFSSTFGNKDTNNNSMNMTVQLNMVDDQSTYYNAGAFPSDGQSVVYGKYKVKVLELGSGNDVTTQFNCSTLDQEGMVPANQRNAFTGTLKDKWGTSYELQVWGTLNGQRHTSGTCACGSTHSEEAVSQDGNILLWSSADDPSNQKFLTLPGENGIAINDVTVSISGSNKLNLNVVNGAGVTDIHSAKVSITDADGNLKANVTYNNISWRQIGTTYSVQSGAENAIGSLPAGNYKATIYFYTSTAATGTQVASVSGINFTK